MLFIGFSVVDLKIEDILSISFIFNLINVKTDDFILCIGSKIIIIIFVMISLLLKPSKRKINTKPYGVKIVI